MNRYSDKFIRDLAQLISHGPEPLDRLIDDLSDPSKRDNLLNALGQLSRAATEASPESHPTVNPSRPFSYDDVQVPKIVGADPRADKDLEIMRQKLVTSANLRNRRVLSNLADEFSISLARRDTMPRIAQKILTSLSTRNAEEISRALSLIKDADRDSTESFMDLANFITRGSANN